MIVFITRQFHNFLHHVIVLMQAVFHPFEKGRFALPRPALAGGFQREKTGAPSPKHGHIFMHPWISRSPRWVRGKIARMLAGKISIAAKIDAFEGEPWGEAEVAKVEERVEALREANKQPPSRR